MNRSRNLKSKIVVTVEGESELSFHERELYFSYDAKVLLNNQFEILDVYDVNVLAYDRDGEEIEPQIEEMSSILGIAKEQAGILALERTTISDFDDDREQY